MGIPKSWAQFIKHSIHTNQQYMNVYEVSSPVLPAGKNPFLPAFGRQNRFAWTLEDVLSSSLRAPPFLSLSTWS